MDMNVLMQPIVLLGSSGLIGFLIGIFLKNAVKYIAIFVGFIFAILAFLDYKGMINIDWNVIASETYNNALVVANQTEQVIRHVATEFEGTNTAVGFVGIGFLGGIVIGWKI